MALSPRDIQAIGRIAGVAIDAGVLSRSDLDVASLMREFSEGDGCEPFEAAVGRPMSRAERDARLHLLRLQCWPELKLARCASMIAERFIRYEEIGWVRDRHVTEAPASEPEATFWAILQGGQRVPEWRQTFRILSSASSDVTGPALRKVKSNKENDDEDQA
ncbi:hypothetical protein [Methyloceanibacter sp.]|uniref:hypothetical protein n=1 Tax=Methyloceanibacter sp. TaxID=1965321 RepID=UPI002CC613C1|nr:hypothetical protein [Methyloceanibacter sp.]HML93250.1 hypothetical protein [Methyloceanibacter sp.]